MKRPSKPMTKILKRLVNKCVSAKGFEADEKGFEMSVEETSEKNLEETGEEAGEKAISH